MQEEEDDFDKEMTLITKNFKRFLRKKVRATTSRKQDEERGKVIRGISRSRRRRTQLTKSIATSARANWHVMHECPFKD